MMFYLTLIEKAKAAADFNIHFLRDNVSADVATGDAVSVLANKIIGIMLFIAGVLAVIYIIYSGILYITAAGNPDATKKGQQGLIYGAIGVAVVVLAYFAVSSIAAFVNKP